MNLPAHYISVLPGPPGADALIGTPISHAGGGFGRHAGGSPKGFSVSVHRLAWPSYTLPALNRQALQEAGATMRGDMRAIKMALS